MPELVQITVDNDGNEKDNGHVWHLVDPANWQAKYVAAACERLGLTL